MGDSAPSGSAPSGTGRLLAGVAWLVLLLGLWLWGGTAPAGAPAGAPGPTTGDMAAAGRPSRAEPPPAHHAAVPRRLDIPALGVRAPVTPGGLDERGTREPPSPGGRTGAVAWYADGAAPDEPGTALMAGRLEGGPRPAVGQEIQVVRADGEVAGFTVTDVRAVDRDVDRDGDGDASDARRAAHAPRRDAPSGLRVTLTLITCAGTHDRAVGTCTDRVVVDAHPTVT
ncbi:sortase domain-containing protein [Streptomyces marokkonensis]|uniref:sortase domain-containing protein n=1 Tax=Streptomyces marokkonensis TaxID=324855 RepID=UPI0011F3A989|nr:class F sortase [Streptomyces marokkonensis]